MWWSIVVQLPGQSMPEAAANPTQMLCSYDGHLYGDRQAKKMAKRVGRDYIYHSANVGQPRLVKSPLEPFGEEEMDEITRAVERGHVPPGMNLQAANELRSMLDQTDDVPSTASQTSSETGKSDSELADDVLDYAEKRGVELDSFQATLLVREWCSYGAGMSLREYAEREWALYGGW